jgi:uncharacterized membrane protein YhaH (DUF805 family)
MGSFSIWHWIIFVFLPIAYCATVVIPIATASPEKRITRKRYAVRIASVFAFVLFALILGRMSGAFSAVVNLSALLIAWVLAVFVYIWSVHRTQDIGWSKWLNLLMMIPVVALVWWLIIMFTPTDAAVAPSRQSQQR